MPIHDYMLWLARGQTVYNTVDKLGLKSVKAAPCMACAPVDRLSLHSPESTSPGRAGVLADQWAGQTMLSTEYGLVFA